MTVKELRAWLDAQGVNENRLIVLSADSEGNRFSPLEQASLQVYVPDSQWSGEIYDEDEPSGRDDEVPVVALWPVN